MPVHGKSCGLSFLKTLHIQALAEQLRTVSLADGEGPVSHRFLVFRKKVFSGLWSTETVSGVCCFATFEVKIYRAKGDLGFTVVNTFQGRCDIYSYAYFKYILIYHSITPWIINIIFSYLLNFMCISAWLYLYMCTICVPGASRVKKRTLNFNLKKICLSTQFPYVSFPLLPNNQFFNGEALRESRFRYKTNTFFMYPSHHSLFLVMIEMVSNTWNSDVSHASGGDTYFYIVSYFWWSLSTVVLKS